MKWFNSIKKLAMPLPKAVGYPQERNKPEDYGINFMENNLEESNADEINKEHQDLKYLGHGFNGVAYTKNDPNVVIKITNDPEEAQSARHLQEVNCPCIPKILEVSQVQKPSSGPSWKDFFQIKLEKIPFLIRNKEEIDSVNKLSEYYQNLGHCPKVIDLIGEKNAETIHKYYNKYKNMLDCLAEHNIFPKYTRADNIGMRNNNEYVLLDLGQLNIVGVDGFPI